MQGGIGRRGGVGGSRGQLPILHPDPPEQQSVPVRVKGLVCGVRWATGTHGPADHTAGTDRITAVQRGQRHERGGGVRRNADSLLFGRDRLTEARNRNRERLIQ